MCAFNSLRRPAVPIVQCPAVPYVVSVEHHCPIRYFICTYKLLNKKVLNTSLTATFGYDRYMYHQPIKMKMAASKHT